jgi:hypothetical protein
MPSANGWPAGGSAGEGTPVQFSSAFGPITPTSAIANGVHPDGNGGVEDSVVAGSVDSGSVVSGSVVSVVAGASVVEASVVVGSVFSVVSTVSTALVSTTVVSVGGVVFDCSARLAVTPELESLPHAATASSNAAVAIAIRALGAITTF